MSKFNWPQNKKFAFTIFDDTDNANLENVKIVYDFLVDLGILTTKSVWVNEPEKEPKIGGVNLTDLAYRKYVQELHNKGVEIGLHNVSASHNTSEQSKLGLERFNEIFGNYPSSFANHAYNKENIYWGSKRLSGIFSKIYAALTSQRTFYGEDRHSPYFWGDLVKQHIRYTRNFVYENINTAQADPYTPYLDEKKPYVNCWFSSANGSNVKIFNKNFTKASIDDLERAGGYCIVYTHFCSFVKDGKLDEKFVETMRYLATKEGWFVPVTELLDFLRETKGVTKLRGFRRFYLEGKWLFEQISKRVINKIKS